MGIDPGCHQPLEMFPSMPIMSSEAIITRRGGETVPRATRRTRRVAPGQQSHAAPSRPRQPGPSAGPACHGGVGQGRLSADLGQATKTPPSRLPLRRRPATNHRRRHQRPPRRLPRPPAPSAPERRPHPATWVP